MYMLLFLGVTILGAFAAWRQNPMYSLGRTVRFLLVVGLTLAAVILALMAALHLTAGRSQAVQFTAIFGVTGLGTLAMIGVIIQISVPRGAALPKSVKLVRFHRAKVDVWARRAGWSVIVVAALAVALPTSGKIVVGTLGGFFAFLAVVMLFAGYMSARKMDQWLTEVELRPWVHWTYTAQQWSDWNALRVKQVEAQPPSFSWRKSWWKLALAMVAITLGVIVFTPGGWGFKAGYLAAVCAMFAGIGFWSAHSEKNAGARTGWKLAAAAPEVYFGEEGLFADGVFLPWISAGVYLMSATMGAGEPVHLSLRFMKIEAGNSSTVVNQGVLLPAGAEADLARLQQELTAKCPKAVVSLA